MPQVNGKYVPNAKAPRTPDNEEPAAERACDFRPVDKGFTKEMALAEANPWPTPLPRPTAASTARSRSA